MKYLSPLEMKQHIIHAKQLNPVATLMGIDIGRSFNGIAVSDKQLKIARPCKTFEVDPQIFRSDYEGSEDLRFFKSLRNLVNYKQVKGIIAGYPLASDGKEVVVPKATCSWHTADSFDSSYPSSTGWRWSRSPSRS